MSNSTPQGPGPEFGSNPDASPIDEDAAVDAAMDDEIAGLQADGEDDGVIDISENDGPALTTDSDDVDAGSA